MRAFKIVLAVSALIATAATVSAVDLKAARKGITAEEAKFCKALMHKDMSWFEAVAAPNFTETDMSGKKSGRNTSLQDMKAGMKPVTFTKVETRLLSLKQSGKSFVAVTQNVVEGRARGADGKTAKFKDTGTQRETWIQSGKKWMITSLVSLTDKMTVNGKPMRSRG